MTVSYIVSYDSYEISLNRSIIIISIIILMMIGWDPCGSGDDIVSYDSYEIS